MIALIVGAVVISFAPILVKWLTLGPASVGFYRTGLSGLLLLVFCLKYRHRKRDNWSLFAAGTFFAVDMYCWNLSIQAIGAGLATIFANTQVFYLSAFECWQQRKWPNRYIVFAILLGFGGIVLLLNDALHGNLDIYGTVAGAMTGLLYTTFILFLQKAQRNSDQPIVNLGIFSVITAAWLALPMSWENNNTIVSFNQGMIVLLYAFVVHLGGWWLLSRAMVTVSPGVIGLVLLLQPVLATIWGSLIFDERLTLLQSIGALSVLLGIVVGVWGRRRNYP